MREEYTPLVAESSLFKPESQPDDATQQSTIAEVGPFEDSDACLKPFSENGVGPYYEYLRHALGLDTGATLAALVVTPSFRPSWILSLHSSRPGRYFLRVTKLDTDLWGSMMKRMSERQGSIVSLDEQYQSEALADLSTKTTIFQRPVDGKTAKLFERLWQGLIARIQVVESVTGPGFDGTGYDFWYGGTWGITLTTRYGSVLERTIFAAEWLRKIVESPSADETEDLRHIRDEMTDALERTKRKESCVRPYRD